MRPERKEKLTRWVVMIAVMLIVILMGRCASAMPGYEKEAFYSDPICEQEMKGVPIKSGPYRPDCLTYYSVVEFDWALKPKIYECLGQALVQGFVFQRDYNCVILATDIDNYELANFLKGAADQCDIGYEVRMIDP